MSKKKNAGWQWLACDIAILVFYDHVGRNLPDVEFMWDIEQDVSWTYDLGALVDSLDLYRSDLLAPR